ncbi:MAG: deoxyribose-phosphate aldolase, partial [Flavobacterium sp.]
MDIRHYLDATYLKTIEDSGLSENQHLKVVEDFISETIDGGFKLVMIRPNMVALARKMIQASHSKVLVGTVIDFPNGDGDLSTKIAEAEKA